MWPCWHMYTLISKPYFGCRIIPARLVPCGHGWRSCMCVRWLVWFVLFACKIFVTDLIDWQLWTSWFAWDNPFWWRVFALLLSVGGYSFVSLLLVSLTFCGLLARLLRLQWLMLLFGHASYFGILRDCQFTGHATLYLCAVASSCVDVIRPGFDGQRHW